MSAIIKLADHQPSQALVPESLEEQFDHINSPEIPLDQKLACALACIRRLQTRVGDMRGKLAKAEREVALREILLRNATLRERELRAQMTGKFL